MVLLTQRLLRVQQFKKLIADKQSPMKGLMSGKYPITKTKQYLNQGIVLRDSVRIMSINYGNYENNYEAHSGVRKIVELNLSQFQHMNPNVQVLVIKDLTPTPFFTFFLENGERFYIDAEGQDQVEILSRIQKVIGKPRELIQRETSAAEPNPANFGPGFKAKCICKIQGQVPCSFTSDVWPMQERRELKKHLNPNPKKYVFGLDDEET
uniref:Small ribosomal subunit protein mS25 n=1 Tax=Ciona savignyi TaxID=51511 RepID=H2ZEG9_CIOSA